MRSPQRRIRCRHIRRGNHRCARSRRRIAVVFSGCRGGTEMYLLSCRRRRLPERFSLLDHAKHRTRQRAKQDCTTAPVRSIWYIDRIYFISIRKEGNRCCSDRKTKRNETKRNETKQERQLVHVEKQIDLQEEISHTETQPTLVGLEESPLWYVSTGAATHHFGFVCQVMMHVN